MFLMVTALTLPSLGVPVHASKMDSRIELSAKQSYLFKTYLQGDDIKIESKTKEKTMPYQKDSFCLR